MRTLLLMLLASSTVGALAQPVSLRGASRLPDATLAEVRGGFLSPATGLAVSFGIDRAVYVNDAPAAATLVQSAGGSGITLVQRGTGNSVDVSAFGALAAGTVVQNSLDNQKIQTVTTIDVRANSLQLWNGANLRTSIGNAITASLQR